MRYDNKHHETTKLFDPLLIFTPSSDRLAGVKSRASYRRAMSGAKRPAHRAGNAYNLPLSEGLQPAKVGSSPHSYRGPAWGYFTKIHLMIDRHRFIGGSWWAATHQTQTPDEWGF